MTGLSRASALPLGSDLGINVDALDDKKAVMDYITQGAKLQEQAIARETEILAAAAAK